ncbi:hypothetical protein GQ457_03G032990 [Hibiscus cannabinus]
MSRIDSQLQGKLPSQTEPNPKENMSTITLRSGTVIEPSVQTQKEKRSNVGSQGDDATEQEASPYAAQPPFPVRFIEEDKRAEENLDVSRKGEVHIPLLEVIREMPSYNVELMFAASFDSKMGCLYSVFDVKKQGKTIWVVRARNWKLRGGENRLSGLLEGVSYDFRVYGSVNKQWGGVVYRSWIFGFDSGIPRVTISGRFCDWTGSRGLQVIY